MIRLIAVSALLALLSPVLAQDGAAPQPSVLERLRARAERGPVPVAHRGDSETLPENTMCAFRGALRAGAPVVEFDVRQTADGVWVCMHDETVDRTTDVAVMLRRTGVKVSDLKAEDFARLDAGGWKGPEFVGEPVPTLEQALATLGDKAIAMVERKAGAAESLVKELRRLGAVERVIVQAFDWQWLQEVHGLAPRICLGALGDEAPGEDLVDRVRRTGAVIVHWNHRSIRLEDVDRLRSEEFLLCAYTANDDAALLGVAAMGIEMITTNRPARLRDLTAARRVLRPDR